MFRLLQLRSLNVRPTLCRMAPKAPNPPICCDWRARVTRPRVVQRIPSAVVGTVKPGVGAVVQKPRLPKILNHISRSFAGLMGRQYIFGATVLLKIDISIKNFEHMRALTEIAHRDGIAIDYVSEELMGEHKLYT